MSATTSEDASPRIPITEDDCRSLAAAMLNPSVSGNLAAAAKLLGLDYNRAVKIVAKDAYLRAINPAVDASKLVPSNGAAINRKPLPADALERARDLVKQNKLLVDKDWRSLGLSEDQAKQMVSMEKFATLPLIHSIKTTHGGMMFSYARLLALFQKYVGELEDRQLPSEDVIVGGESMPRDSGDVERDWLHAIVSISAEMRQVNGQLMKGNLLLMKAKQLEKEMGKGKGKGKRDAQVLVNAQPGATVNLNPPASAAQASG